MKPYAMGRLLNRSIDVAPLVVFRICFGLLMFVGLVRFVCKGWVSALYIRPQFFFKYYGLEWVRPFGGWTYLLFFIAAISALFIALGYRYRLSCIVFFLSFTYMELIDKTTYLNHYYFISCLSFLMIFLPANRDVSVDVKRGAIKGTRFVENWSVAIVRLFVGLVYFYAGVAKLHPDWLFEAMPLKLWLPQRFGDEGWLNDLFRQPLLQYAFSWLGMAFDLFIPLLLLFRKTRVVGFVLVLIFHTLTSWFFPIGMFPLIMIFSAMIFFSSHWHRGISDKLAQFLPSSFFAPKDSQALSGRDFRWYCVLFFLFFQILFPLRRFLYPGNLLWNEEGFRFAWHVMVMEKRGYCQFRVVTGEKQEIYVEPKQFLTPFQEQQMCTQPDFILEFARFLSKHYRKGSTPAHVFADCHVSLNGRMSKVFIDPNTDLSIKKDGFSHKSWINPF